LGGIIGLSYLAIRVSRDTAAVAAPQDAGNRDRKRRASVDAIGLYWHFMDGLWVYLFALLFLWR
jgi:heme/copper-type cytochrome/quinol oxidase subunit 3